MKTRKINQFAFRLDRSKANFFVDLLQNYFPELTVIGQEDDENADTVYSFKNVTNGAYILVSNDEDYDITWYPHYHELLEHTTDFDSELPFFRECMDDVVTKLVEYTKEEYPRSFYKRLRKNWREELFIEQQRQFPRREWTKLGNGFEIKIMFNNIMVYNPKDGITMTIPKSSEGLKKLSKNTVKITREVYTQMKKEGLIR